MKAFFCTLIIIMSFAVNTQASGKASHIPLTKPGRQEYNKHQTNELFKSYLEASSFRHKILSQNIANVNTPGYKANEVEMPDTFDDLNPNNTSVKKVRMATTSRNHIVPNRSRERRFSSHKIKNPDEIKKNGNNVSLRQQMTKLSQNKNDYAAVMKTYAATNSLFSAVIGK
jgi:flagellar basal-body rod protein FlgB